MFTCSDHLTLKICGTIYKILFKFTLKEVRLLAKFENKSQAKTFSQFIIH